MGDSPKPPVSAARGRTSGGEPNQTVFRRFMLGPSGKGSRWPFLSLAFAVSVGALAGVGTTTFQYAEGLSYFERDPAACANCHIMQSNLDSWQKSSHHAEAVCVDCHLPTDFFPKYRRRSTSQPSATCRWPKW
jgi:hypothetical protein